MKILSDKSSSISGINSQLTAPNFSSFPFLGGIIFWVACCTDDLAT